jgi:hypothetical protein
MSGVTSLAMINATLAAVPLGLCWHGHSAQARKKLRLTLLYWDSNALHWQDNQCLC